MQRLHDSPFSDEPLEGPDASNSGQDAWFEGAPGDFDYDLHLDDDEEEQSDEDDDEDDDDEDDDMFGFSEEVRDD